MRLTGHSNTSSYLKLGNMERKTGRVEGKPCFGPEALKQEKSEEGISRPPSLQSLFQSQCPPPKQPVQGTLGGTPGKGDAKSPNSPWVASLRTPFVLPFSTRQANSGGFCRPAPRAGWNLGKERTLPHSVGTERALAFLWSKGTGGRQHGGK